jgi:hypothetical protein
MLSQVPEGLLILLDRNWTWVGDATFKVLDPYLDLALCSGDIAQCGILWNACPLPLCLSFEVASSVANVQAAAVFARINDHGTVPVQSGGVSERGEVIDMAPLSETRKVLVSPFKSHCISWRVGCGSMDWMNWLICTIA